MKKIGRRCNKLYRRLCINRSATKKEIKAAYREMVREAHPDTGGSNEDFIKVQEAYHVLSDKSRKRHYDQTGEWVAMGIPEQTRIQQKANDVLAAEFARILSEKSGEIFYIDVIRTIKNGIRAKLQHADKNLKEIKATLDAASNILELIEYKGKSVNVLEGVMFNIISENEHAKVRFLDEKEGFLAALDIIVQYRYNFKSKGAQNFSYEYINVTTTSG